MPFVSAKPSRPVDRGVEQPARRFGSRLRALQSLAVPKNFGGVCLLDGGDLSERFGRSGHGLLDRLREQGSLGSAPARVQDAERLVHRTDAGQRIAADEVVVERRHGQAGHEGVDPDRDPREFDGGLVHVHAMNAAAGDLAAEQRRGLEFGTVSAGGRPGRPERFARLALEPAEFVVHAGERAVRQETAHPPLDAVDGRDREVARAHRDVGDAEVPEGFGGARMVAPAVQCLHALQVLRQDRLQCVVKQVLHRELGREVGAGRLALAGPVVEVDVALRDDDLVFRPSGHVDVLLVDRQVHVGPAQLGFEQPFVDRPELAHGE